MTTANVSPRAQRLRDEMLGHLKAAQAVYAKADAAGRDVTTAEHEQATTHFRRSKETKAVLDQEINDVAMRAAIGEFGDGIGLHGGPVSHANPRVKALGGSAWGARIVESQCDSAGQFKALLPAGVVPVTVPLNPEPVRADEPVLALRQLIPTVADTAGRWSYMVQLTRTSNAAVVAPGALKPTSPYSLERRENRARTLAHLSEGLQRQDLDDAPMLREFIDTELRLGLEIALENEIVNGDGTGERFVGLANVSGSQMQAFATDLLTTTRRAITKLEVLNLAATGFVFHPADWESIEMAGNEYGYALAQAGQAVPVNRAARRLWGVPVALSTTVTAGTGFVADFAGSTQLKLREDARVDWSEAVWDPNALGAGAGASDYTVNKLRFRAEMRAGLDIMRPAGVVELDLTAA